MSLTKRLQDATGGMDEFQKDTIAELASADYLLKNVWEDCVHKYVRMEVWSSYRMQASIVHRVEEIVQELDNDTIIENLDEE